MSYSSGSQVRANNTLNCDEDDDRTPRENYDNFIPRQNKKELLKQQFEKDLQNYESYRQSNKLTEVSIIPQSTGGNLTMEQARIRKQQEVKRSFKNAHKRFHETRIREKEAEEQKLLLMKQDARKKAELLAEKEKQATKIDQEILRRKRMEHFSKLGDSQCSNHQESSPTNMDDSQASPWLRKTTRTIKDERLKIKESSSSKTTINHPYYEQKRHLIALFPTMEQDVIEDVLIATKGNLKNATRILKG